LFTKFVVCRLEDSGLLSQNNVGEMPAKDHPAFIIHVTSVQERMVSRELQKLEHENILL